MYGCWLADGETWQDGSNWNPSGPGSAYGETQIALLSDRKTILNIGHGDRTKERYQMFAETTNGGESWGPVYRRPELVNVGCQQSMTGHTEDDGRHFLYYAAPRGGLMPLTDFDEITSRRDGTVFASQDDGKSWWLLEPSIIRQGPFMCVPGALVSAPRRIPRQLIASVVRTQVLRHRAPREQRQPRDAGLHLRELRQPDQSLRALVQRCRSPRAGGGVWRWRRRAGARPDDHLRPEDLPTPGEAGVSSRAAVRMCLD